MNRKTKITIGLFAVLLIAAITVGTVAYFSKSFASDNNVATAASFEVDVVNADGETIGDGEFNLGDKLYPGVENKEVYTFQIKKGNTDVPVEYNVNLNESGALFPDDNSSPVVLTLQRNIDSNWTDVNNGVVSPESDTEDYRVLVSWPHGDNDIDFQGATGTVHLDVVATQVDGNTEEEASTMLDEVAAELEAIAKINNDNHIRRGNFSKAQSDAVQDLLDAAKDYISEVPSGKAELLERANTIQQELDELVESRYVYYEVIDEETHFRQLQLKLTANYEGVVREELARPLWVAGVFQDGEKYFKMKYHTAPEKAEAGDVFKLGMRFWDATTIDATFTNLGDGNWKIESDWLVEKK